MPDRISEATRPWEWVANLRVNFDPALVRFVEVVGSGANVFDAWLDRRLGLITVAPVAMPDFEAFLRDGRAPELSLQLRFFLADGTVRDSAQTWRVAVDDVDDTPPESLAFATGGTVRANTPGAVIGRLAVTDPDTAPGNFRFSFLPWDEWMFEIVNGDTLKLRDGVVIPKEDAPVRPIYIEVSDGTNSSAHILHIEVDFSLPGLPRGASLVNRGERSGPLYVVNAETARVDLAAFQLAGINGYGQVFELSRQGQSSLWFERTRQVDLLDGLLDADRTGNGIRIHLMYDTVLQRAPTAAEMTAANAALVAGTPIRRLVDELTNTAEFRAKPAAASPEAFFQQVYTEIWGWWDNIGVGWHAGQVRQGASRGFQTEQIISWATGLDVVKARADEGFWVPHLMADPMLAIHRVGTGAISFAAYGGAAQVNATGGMVWQAAWSIANGPAFQARFGWMDNATFVDAMYREVLGRGPQNWAEFSRFWTPLEQGRMQRHDVLFQFVTQVDTSPVPANPAPGGHALPHLLTHGIGELLDIAFGAATPAAWTSPDAQAAMDNALRQAAREVARTPEFRERYGHLSNSEFIDRIFVEAYDRPVDWAGFSRLFFPLDRGWMGRGDILYVAATDPRATAPFLRDLSFDLL
jgi:hypothetical protein